MHFLPSGIISIWILHFVFEHFMIRARRSQNRWSTDIGGIKSRAWILECSFSGPFCRSSTWRIVSAAASTSKVTRLSIWSHI
jgi:hypothetical protein